MNGWVGRYADGYMVSAGAKCEAECECVSASASDRLIDGWVPWVYVCMCRMYRM